MNIEHPTLFATLGNETRLRCLYLVATLEEACVCEVVEALGVSQPTASKALIALKNIGLLKDRRDANWIYYSLDEAMSPWQAAVVDATIRDLAAEGAYVSDETRGRNSRVRSAAGC
ncbi:MAG: metalloregulator ArsR/SmtB family transcription factor [Pseudomonadota bacterium]